MTYLDNAATTPLRPQARDRWLEVQDWLQTHPGNPNALHSGGRAARRLLEDAREAVAHHLGVERPEVVFTSGATESNALAIAGGFRAMKTRTGRNLVQVCAADHPSTRNQRGVVEREGGQWQVLDIDRDTRVLTDQVQSNAAVISVASVCSETGAIQPMEQISQARGGGAERPLLHVDASQAIHTESIDARERDWDLVTVAGHKVGAPVGVGALVVRRGVKILTDRPGGDQENKVRSGTQDVAGACALAAALEAVAQERDALVQRCKRFKEQIIAQLPTGVHPTLATGPVAPTILHLSVPTAHPEAVLLGLDRVGIMASAGSACHAGVTRPSEVLLAAGRCEREALGVLRVSFGPLTTMADVEALSAVLPEVIATAQQLDALDH
ncbi:aminotransferase class V-fold PLP-dependent enzyme [Gleimia hominis]|uniref:Aminotransferase class V-fold PLP-dependent enzyme n=1 Tax=Gleimia hominis TaxID=595468 RepID=A0ABU3IAM2_9ACTO|nr:aminotransferase class V-fold PLP-dependent enzyme [Gleimia hominis]MDT3767424.1 aminotransferase class V-fold PLP-dependent enzyme [Gleimia hominis]